MYEARQNKVRQNKERVSRQIDARGTAEKKNVRNENTVVQRLRGYNIGGRFMEKEVFSNHAQKAQAYYTNAVTKRNEYTSPITIAHHRGTNCACGKECPGEHAEIKLLKAFPGVPDFEMGITSPMCDGRKYLGNNCQENIKNGYEKNKVIFAQDPGGLFVFPPGHQARIGASSLEEKNYCMICNKEINGGEICDDCEEMINDDSPFDFETTLN